MPESVLLVITTCPDEVVAKHIAHELVAAKLAACVQIYPGLQSIYQWLGEICEAPELALHIKCLLSQYPAVQQKVLELHPYDVPELLALPVTLGLPSYFEWIKDTTQP